MKLRFLQLMAFMGAIFFLIFISSISTPPIPPIIKEVIKEVEVERFVYLNQIYTDEEVNSLIVSIKEDDIKFETVLKFYDSKTKNRNVTLAILNNCLERNVALNFGFALAWKESRFNPKQVYSNKDSRGRVLSTDWGLFQLNDKERPTWRRADFFNIEKNAKEGISFISYLKKMHGSYDIVSASYNAGQRRITVLKNIPYSTWIHNYEIRKYHTDLDEEFSEKIAPKLAG